MKFNSDKPIYTQIADILLARILEGVWMPEAKIPSIRETAVLLEVNPNTAARAFTFLQEREIIYNVRGMGFYVSADGRSRALQLKKSEFVEEQIPVLKQNMKMLSITNEELLQLLKK